MRIWLATVGEPLPEDGENVRLLRTAQFAQWLSDHGHDVVFWTGTMDHSGRRLRREATGVSQLAPNYRIVQLAGRLYKRSVSYNRFMNHVDVAKEFAAHAAKFEAPDIILASFPTEELCREILDHAEPREIPVVVDVRDLWPDVFIDALPRPARPFAPLLFLPFERRAAQVFRRATAISGPARSMINWGVAKSGRQAGPDDFWFPFTYPPAPPAAKSDVPEFLADGAPALDGLRFCFFGAISFRYNLEMVVDCFKELERDGVKASAIICGTGDALDTLRKRAEGAGNVYFPGWMNLAQIRAIMARSHAGIFPYNTPDYFNNLPNKVCEYLAGGLPIVSCTHGEVKRLVEETGCGFWHEPDGAAMARLVRGLVADPSPLASAAAKAKEVYATNFEREAVFSRTLDNLQRIAAGRARDRASTTLHSAA